MADLNSTSSVHQLDEEEKENRNVMSDKLKRQQQSRPRLGHLRSAWTTSDLFYPPSTLSYNTTITSSSSSSSDNDIEDTESINMYKLQLPQIILNDKGDEFILTEIRRMIYIANFLCLFESLIESAVAICTLPWEMPYIILPAYTFWWLGMMWALRKNKNADQLCHYLNWATVSALIMATTNLSIITSLPFPNIIASHPAFLSSSLIQPGRILLIALSILTMLLFRFANRLLIAYRANSNQIQNSLISEQTSLQYFVDQRTEAFQQHQLAFLTTVSQEIQDVALMVITTLEQFSPTSILFSCRKGGAVTHELLSACSLSVPIASISAIGVMIRQVCHVSSHLQLLSALSVQTWSGYRKSTITDLDVDQLLPDLVMNEFDIGELLQNVGDALAGVASKLDVKFVIYHYDNSLHHTSVIGDEGAIRHALLNHLRNVLECCTPGTCIEVGLNVTPKDRTTTNEKKCKITFYITHTSSASDREDAAALLPNANLTAQLLSYIHATSSAQQTNEQQTEFEFSFELEYGNNQDEAANINNKQSPFGMFGQDEENSNSSLLKQYYSNIKFSNEPSLKELDEFIERLKGLKMVLHATEQSIFAKHLTSCLASWNTDISHVPITTSTEQTTAATRHASNSEEQQHHPESATANLLSSRHLGPSTPPVPSPLSEEEQIHAIPPAFILIDDDLSTLERKLHEFRSQPPASANVLQQAVHHGRRSHNKKSSSQHNNFFHHGGSSAIIYFTSLARYKAVRDVIQCYALSSSVTHPFSMPRVVVMPKPAGPRRFLTALHTIWHHAVVEPHFSAIATSPLSPIPPIFNHILQSPRGTGSPDPATHATTRRSTGEQAHYFTPHRRSSQHEQDYFVTSGTNASLMNALTAAAAVSSSSSSSAAVAAVAAAAAVAATTTTTTTGAPPMEEGVVVSGELRPDQVMSETGQPLDSVRDPNVLVHPNSTNATITTPTTNTTTTTNATATVGTTPIVAANAATTANATSTVVGKDGVETPKKKIMSRTMTNFKLNKKKKKAKGTPFTDVISPPINVLIVEDNIINQAILSAWMKKHQIKFSVASNGKEAVDKWKMGGFHLILMDIQLPVMDGIEATKMIRSIEKEQKIGVLPMSSSFLRQQQVVAAATAEKLMQRSGTEEELTTLAAVEAIVAEEQQQREEAMTPSTVNEDEEDDNTKDNTKSHKPSVFRSPVIIVALTASSLESDRHAALAAGCNDFLTKPVSLEWLEKKIIEWGCMQALIDFEGWRRWKKTKKSTSHNNTKKGKQPQKTPPLPTEAKVDNSTKPKTTTTTQGILLPGIGHLVKSRRSNSSIADISSPTTTNTATAFMMKKAGKKIIALKASKSDSDTPQLLSNDNNNQKASVSQSDTTTNLNK